MISRNEFAAVLAAVMAGLAMPFSVSAQTAASAPSGDTEAAPEEQTVKMSAFEVTTTQGHGYVATNADAGFKTTQRLIDIPQDIQVVTRDMIDDIGASDSSVVNQYFGEGGVSFLGEATAMRGYAAKYPYVDDQPENQPYEDNFFVDSYVEVRGEAQVLYLNVNPTGISLKYTKKPLPYNQTILTAAVTSWGGTRVLLDTTGPIGTLGAVKFSYRFDALQQGPNDYFYNVHQSTEGLYPVIQMDINNTTVRIYQVFLDIMHVNGGTALIQPDGKLYQGAGSREVNQPPNDMEHHEEHRTHFDLEDKASDNWDFRFGASYWHYYRYNPIIDVNNYNWANQTMNFFSRLNDETVDYFTMIGDASGKYYIGPLSQQENFGFGYTDQLIHEYFPPTPDFVNGQLNIPLNSVAAINALRVPAVSEFPPLGSSSAQAQHNQLYVSSIYYQHTLDIIPKYLTGVVGWTFATVISDNVGNVSTIPYSATVVPLSQWIHRFGLVAHPIKEVAIYALTSTGFAPPAGAAPTLYSGAQAPPQSYEGNEVGMKTDILNGKISSTFTVFKISETNLLTVGPGFNVLGQGYYIPIGAGVGEGMDGDIELFLTNNWQLIAYGYSGHWNDQNGRPLPSSYDNSWSLFTRYAFPADSPLKGLSVGGGAKQVGGAFVNSANLLGYAFAPVPAGSTVTIKVQKGFDSTLFATYPITKHFTARVQCANLTDNHYPIGFQGATFIDASPPRTFTFELDAKF